MVLNAEHALNRMLVILKKAKLQSILLDNVHKTIIKYFQVLYIRIDSSIWAQFH